MTESFATRTNYFRVTDVKRFKEILKHFPNVIILKDETQPDHYAFGCYETESDGENEYTEIMDACDDLQKILHPNDAIVIITAGHERLKYVNAYARIITVHGYRNVDFLDIIRQDTKILLDDTNYVLKITN